MSETKILHDRNSDASLTRDFIASFRAGRVCVHPTDTVLGLTFDPASPKARLALGRLKGRADDKPCLGLVASFAEAQRYFAPLPPGWGEALARLWPGPLSVVWEASAAAPTSLVAADGTIGLRVPSLPAEADWFRAVLALAGVPLPTTSLNRSGEPAMRHIAEARATWTAEHDLHAPDFPVAATSVSQPSTVIRLRPDGSYEILRSGAMAVERLIDAVGLAPRGMH